MDEPAFSTETTANSSQSTSASGSVWYLIITVLLSIVAAGWVLMMFAAFLMAPRVQNDNLEFIGVALASVIIFGCVSGFSWSRYRHLSFYKPFLLFTTLYLLVWTWLYLFIFQSGSHISR